MLDGHQDWGHDSRVYMYQVLGRYGMKTRTTFLPVGNYHYKFTALKAEFVILARECK